MKWLGWNAAPKIRQNWSPDHRKELMHEARMSATISRWSWVKNAVMGSTSKECFSVANVCNFALRKTEKEGALGVSCFKYIFSQTVPGNLAFSFCSHDQDGIERIHTLMRYLFRTCFHAGGHWSVSVNCSRWLNNKLLKGKYKLHSAEHRVSINNTLRPTKSSSLSLGPPKAFDPVPHRGRAIIGEKVYGDLHYYTHTTLLNSELPCNGYISYLALKDASCKNNPFQISWRHGYKVSSPRICKMITNWILVIPKTTLSKLIMCFSWFLHNARFSILTIWIRRYQTTSSFFGSPQEPHHPSSRLRIAYERPNRVTCAPPALAEYD